MSLVAHRFGRVVSCCFLQASAVEKFKINIRNSTCPNRWATKDIKQEFVMFHRIYFLKQLLRQQHNNYFYFFSGTISLRKNRQQKHLRDILLTLFCWEYFSMFYFFKCCLSYQLPSIHDIEIKHLWFSNYLCRYWISSV